MMCHRIGLPPISTIGFGRNTVSSESRVPLPPASRTAFIALHLSRQTVLAAGYLRRSCRVLDLGRGASSWYSRWRIFSCYEEVVKTFGSIPGVNIIKGVVPDTLPQVNSDRICYLSIDMVNAAPEIAAAECFRDRIIGGGIIVPDDCGWKKPVNQTF